MLGLTGCLFVRPHPPKVKPGDEQLDLVLPRFPGPGQVNLAELKGKVVLVDFWATWCGPCHDAAVAYQGLYQRYGAQGLEVYGISVDEDPNQIAGFVQQQGLTYPILRDPSAELCAPRFSLNSIPSVLLADRSGKIRFTHAGFSDAELSVLTREIEDLLAEPAR